MRNVVILLAALAAATANAVTEVEAYAAWAGSRDTAPCYATPQNLVANADDTLGSGDLAKLDEDGGWGSAYCYYYFEPTNREHDYIVVKFVDIGSYDVCLSRWRADGAYPSTNTSRAYFWDGENWDPWPYGNENEGGNDPEAETCHVEDYVLGGELLLLIQTRTEEEGQTQFNVTWADVIYE